MILVTLVEGYAHRVPDRLQRIGLEFLRQPGVQIAVVVDRRAAKHDPVGVEDVCNVGDLQRKVAGNVGKDVTNEPIALVRRQDQVADRQLPLGRTRMEYPRMHTLRQSVAELL